MFTVKILLYAGNSCISSPLVFITLGKIYLNLLPGQSAGNFSFSTKATAKTKNTYNSYTNLPIISEHVSKHKSNLTDTDFGYFLAGLIEGDGWFGKKELHIIFAESDISLAYLIKKRIGHGNVYKIKNKKAVRYICKNAKGLFIILSLINGKLVSKPKYEQLIKHNYSADFNYTILPPSNSFTLDNYWLAGFSQADGCFHISLVKSKTHKTGYSVRLEFSLKQNDAVPLKLLYNTVKMGNLSQYSSGIWCYKSSGFKTAALLINYFDTCNLFAGKYVNYLKFRKVYIMITNGRHLENKGITKIKSIATKGSSETSTQEV
uniref:LAGLIDADG homing endonuclease n=1 Tax=Porodaedalea chrysoloma TaxID=74615 RepID=UPI0023AAB474|nr:LAGLIDADG homing endonuclease [Porodaedalea chrysoloma]WCF76761.1 LAGLIDADG homing endonuclease [Porodaedalea chrysoloma]